MIPKKKIFLLLPDGVGLRNFTFSTFVDEGKKRGYDITYWNATPFAIKEMGYQEIKLGGTMNPKTDLLKRARKEIELNAFKSKTKNPVFSYYSFRPTTKTLKQKIKNTLVKWYAWKYQNKLPALRKELQQSERQSPYYKHCLATLKEEQPALVFCTNQRPVNAIAPLTAAQDLGIPTATFIFSWDNLPKATMVVETDYYFVWSEHMKAEMLFYYPYIKENQIISTGTPQFEMHFDAALKQSREAFCDAHKLDPNKKYLCFSGDDVTTSPHDPVYLKDVAETIRNLNQQKDQWRILFRRCPVDFSNRFEEVLQSYVTEIQSLPPLWEKMGAGWNTVLPTKEDNALLLNTVAHSELVINVGSSMIFDAVCHATPCVYIAYNPEEGVLQKDIHSIYNYIHFQSMPREAPVFWLKNKEALPEILTNLDQKKGSTLEAAQSWFQTINQHPPQNASKRIWEGIKKSIQ
ncbi:UDP-glycosyltransferase [uncultured Planktosalinus sp.]|uniref:UDP-glycosyltransferase n=1 Tax=uncultured Planktosalinus sp. TaxID=1810935 RepID=UPI0030DBC5EC